MAQLQAEPTRTRRRRPGPAPHLRLERPVPEPLPAPPVPSPGGPTKVAPPIDRYRVRRAERGRVLNCVEAPTLHVRAQRGFSVTATAARAYPSGSIFLDGAAQGAPFIDPERDVYNLDHHEGCVRAFTLSTCEQAMVLVRRGIDLRKRDRTIYANDADLDTVLAIWVLLNHIRLNEDERLRAEIMPLVRLQGVIDAQGLGMEDLCGLPPELHARTRARMDRLRRRELALKASGRWDEIDLLQYLADQLRTLDSIAFAEAPLGKVEEVEEIARTEIAHGSFAVVCRSGAGIYEVEQTLRRLHGDRLGVIVLQTRSSAYSLRQVDPALPASLDRLYERLNLVDPAVGSSRSPNRWGGSAEIGGSPRKTGTRVSPQGIIEACQHVYRRPPLGDQLKKLGRAGAISALLFCVAAAAIGVPGWPGLRQLAPVARLGNALPFGLGLAALSGALLLLVGGRTPGRFGRRVPSGSAALGLAPFAVLAGVGGGAWVATLPSGVGLATGHAVAALLLLPIAAELTLRGLVHGSLASVFRIQSSAGRWFVSVPTLATAALGAVWLAALSWLGVCRPPIVLAGVPLSPVAPYAAALLLGLVAGLARERSESVVAPIALHATAVAAAAALPLLG